MSESSVKNGWIEGKGEYTFPNGTVYSGDFINDEFDGEGTLTFPDGDMSFGDGLDFEDKDWGYLNNGDRRFYDEVKHGIRPAGASLLTNDPKGPPKIPKGCYDVGNGYFDPVENKTFSYDGSRMIGKPGEEEIKWIKNTVMKGFKEYVRDATSHASTATAHRGDDLLAVARNCSIFLTMDGSPMANHARSVSDASDIPTVEDTASVVTNAVETDSIASVRDSSVSFDLDDSPLRPASDQPAQDGVSLVDSSSAQNPTQEKTDTMGEARSRGRSESSDAAMCRICGQGVEEGPLYHPCRCSGSIAYVHEQCLRRWLAMRRTGRTDDDDGTFILEDQRCELCGHKFSFRVVYAPNAPSHLPVRYFLSETWKLIFSFVKKCFRPLYALTIWLVLLPLMSMTVLADIFGVIDGFPDRLQIYGFVLGPSSSSGSQFPWLAMIFRRPMLGVLCGGILISLCGFGLLQLWLHMRVAAVPMVVPTEPGDDRPRVIQRRRQRPAATSAATTATAETTSDTADDAAAGEHGDGNGGAHDGGDDDDSSGDAPTTGNVEEAEIEVRLENLIGLEGSLGPSISTWFVMLYANTIAMLALIVVPYYIGRIVYVHFFPAFLAYTPSIANGSPFSSSSSVTTAILATTLSRTTSFVTGIDNIENAAQCPLAPTLLQPTIPEDPYLVFVQRIQDHAATDTQRLYPRPLVDDFPWDLICLSFGGLLCTQVAAMYHLWSTRGGAGFIGRVLSIIGTALKYCVVIITGGFLPSLAVGCVVLLALESAGTHPLEPSNERSLMSLALGQLPVVVGAILVMLVGHLVISITQAAEQGVLSCLKPQAKEAMRESPAMVACFGHIIGRSEEEAGGEQRGGVVRNKGMVPALYYSLIYIVYKLALVFLCVLPALAFQHRYLPLQTRLVVTESPQANPEAAPSAFATSGSLDYLFVPVEFLCGHVLFPLVVRKPPMPPILASLGRKIVKCLGLSSPFLDCAPATVEWTLPLVLKLLSLLSLAATCTLVAITTLPLIVGRRACRLLLPASVLHYVDDLQAAPMGVVLTLLGGQVILRLMTAMSSIPAATRSFLTRLANNQHLIRSFLRNTGRLLFSLFSLLAATIFTFVIAPLLLGLLLYCVLVLPNSSSDVVNTASAPTKLFVFPCWVAGLVAMKVWILTIATRADVAWTMYDSHGIFYPPLHREVCVNLLWPSVRVWLFHSTVPSAVAKVLTVYLLSTFDDSVEYFCAFMSRYSVLLSVALDVCIRSILPTVVRAISDYHRRMFDERYLVSTELENFDDSTPPKEGSGVATE
ncbi:hypothetical protein FOZ60_001038 [Perkinsus olseni]|uniref:RING-type E3 ubiquitin transferase n=2 Tax=Perkinsus olseni TaxID=32597 RepID=A0A7J6P290_PEROL|nr:hypothetical protein FOZ60_001038 [Perkinsus olseni]